jgi:hypothetical protein
MQSNLQQIVNWFSNFTASRLVCITSEIESDMMINMGIFLKVAFDGSTHSYAKC